MWTSDHKVTLLPLFPLFLHLPAPSKSQGCNLSDNPPTSAPASWGLHPCCVAGDASCIGGQLFSLDWINCVLFQGWHGKDGKRIKVLWGMWANISPKHLKKRDTSAQAQSSFAAYWALCAQQFRFWEQSGAEHSEGFWTVKADLDLSSTCVILSWHSQSKRAVLPY